ncbi:electron transfer flavoprotein subunit beta/FixA family protein [Schnuerera sp. xch1]|uniref:electron transfer flavoprotein subunit beta/FixA family protein n=1 Tax=Schnuerera sp. xch1 TaxID=2874283 RepID=UPI001CBC6445|nr:electron transfer flavoprotein subunit beta/FixA family protein [Schnuerera sp. xch1]MBZ2174308.1 electron transfer flavoprotein subunit beta/FixA family protein [Schnuerera sp. xch1]
MNITVCIKQVPSTSEVEIDEKTGNLKRDGVDSKINPYDLFAIEEAIRLKERIEASVSVLTMGPPQAEEVLQESFTLGADKGFLITDRKCAGADVLATAKALAEGIKKIGNADLIICGKQTTDGDTAQVGAEIAEFLDIPHANNILEVKQIKESSIVVDFDLPTMVQTVEIQLPCLISLDKDINQPRLPSYKLKKKTQNKKIITFGVDDFEDPDDSKYGMNGSVTQVVRIFPPESNEETETWEGNAEELSERITQKILELKIV